MVGTSGSIPCNFRALNDSNEERAELLRVQDSQPVSCTNENILLELPACMQTQGKLELHRPIVAEVKGGAMSSTMLQDQ